MADGDIVPLHSFDHCNYAIENNTVKVSDNIVAVVYRDSNINGVVATLNINDDGTITSLYTHSFGRCQYPYITHVSGSVYAIVYAHTGQKGYVKTVNIDSSGVITGIHNTIFSADRVIYPPFIMHTSSNVYMIVHCDYDGNYDTYVTTININDDGTNIYNIQSLRFTAATLLVASGCYVSGTKYAIAHSDQSMRCVVRTYDISDSGNITSEDSYVCATSGGVYPKILKLSNGVFGVAYCGAPWNPSGIKIKTIGIADTGNITGEIDYYDTLYPDRSQLSFIHCGGDIYILVCRTAGGGPWGDLYTVGISKNGTISGNIDDHRITDPDCSDPDALHISGSMYGVAYTSYNTYGEIRTFDIDAPSGMIVSRTRFTSGLSHRSFR